MQCPKCHSGCPPEFDFCPRCAASLQVTCPQCSFRAPADFSFCPKCAAALATPAVAAERDTQALLSQALQRHMPKEYAERLLATRGQPHDERRTVTILFSDIKGSTAMVGKLDPEDAKEVIQGAFEFLIAPIYRYEGTLVQLMGDAILAFFGAPIAHEDDPERACRAALEITTEAQRYAEKLKGERGIEGFDVRVGINTGLVVVGEVGSDLRVAYTAVGDAINLAARMQQNAEPGTVLVTEATHKLVAPLFETQEMPPLAVKGKAEPVSTYRVLAAKPVAGKVRGIAGLESPLVGREPEMAALREALERLRAGVGGIVTIVGEAGLGKSRLVAEVRKTLDVIVGDLAVSSAMASPCSGEAISRSQEGDCYGENMPRNDDRERMPRPGGRERVPRGDVRARHVVPVRGSVLWVEGRCLSYGTAVPYLLWLELLRGLVGAAGEDVPQVVRRTLQERVQALCPQHVSDVYPYLAQLMALPLREEEAAQLAELEGQELKSRTFQAVHTLLECAARERPLVLVCEDLHWADPVSLDLLERLLALTERSALLIVCVFRPEPQHGSWRLRELATGRYPDRYTDLQLQPLSGSDSEMLVSNLLRVEHLPAALKQRILGTAEGNPFYVEEILRGLMDSAAIARDPSTGRWVATRDVADITIPDTLQGVLLARIDRLQEDTKRVLQMAAVIGRMFLYRVLGAIAQEERDLDQHLLTLQREEMVRERARIPELEYVFKHELTREAAYNGLLKKERRTYHRQVAEALEQLFPERIEEQVGLLAYHWEQAGAAEKATGYLLRAGDEARSMYAEAQAVDYYRRALVFLEQAGDAGCESAARAWMKVGLTYHNAFDFQQARLAYERGFALWQRASTIRVQDLPPAPHALRLAASSVPLILDPAMASDTLSVSVIQHVFSGLVEHSPELDIIPAIARSWDLLEGGRRYVFHLREDVRWSDGTSVTADDFAYSFKRVLDPALASPQADLLCDIRGGRAFHAREGPWEAVGVRAVGRSTLAIELEQPTGYFLHVLALACCCAVPRHVVEMHGRTWIEPGKLVTNGPFWLETWTQGQPLVLVRNPQYHGQFRGNVQRVELYPLADNSTLLPLYGSDRLDVINPSDLPAAQWTRARERHAAEYLSFPMLHMVYLGFSVHRPPFDDARVRRAFALACDRETIIKTFGGYALPASGGFVPPGMPGHSPGIALPYDPDRARRLLAEAGYPPGGSRTFPTVEWLVLPIDEEPSHLSQGQWRENLGLDIQYKTVEWPVLLERLAREPPDIWRLGWWADYPDPDSFLRVGFPWKQTGWRNEAYERLVEEARRVQDPDERMRMYREADRILVEEAPVVPVAYWRFHLLVKPWVRRYPVSPIRDWFWKDVVIEAH